MKLLLHSNAPWAPTGYGNQVGLFAPRLKRAGYEVGVSCFYGLEGAPLPWKGIVCLPGLGGEFGNGYVLEHASYFFTGDNGGKADPAAGLWMSLMDVWVLDPARIAQLNACCWVPVDHDPISPAVEGFFKASGAVPLAISRFGEERLEKFNPIYVPHGVDTESFRPYERKEARQFFNWEPEWFVVGMNAANKGSNPSRKGFQQAFEAFAELRRRHDNAVLYLHTGMDPNIAHGEDIPALLASFAIPPDSVKIANQYMLQFAPFSSETMGKLMSALDVLLNPAMGEGFGIPCMEAQAAGTPVIGTNFSAMEEVIGAGWKVSYDRFWTGQKSFQAMPKVPEIVEALEDCYSLPDSKRESLSVAARQHALKYDADKVLEEHMLPALKEVEERMKPKAPSAPAKVVS